MICKNCNETIPDDSTFCQFCGYQAEPAEPAPEAAYTEPLTEVTPEDDYSYSQPETFEDPQPEKPKKKIGLIIALACVAASLFFVLVAGLLTNWFGLNGPMMQIARGANKTLKAGSFTVDFDVSIAESYFEENVKGTASVAIDPKKEEVTLFAEATMDGEKYIIAIYDEYLIAEYDGEYTCQDISDELDEFFEYYEKLEDNISLKPDWEEIIDNEYAYEAMEEVIDFDELNDALPKFLRKLNSQSWLKKNAGYSVKRVNGVKMHTFKPDVYKLLSATLPIFEDVFADEDTYEDLEDNLEYVEDFADEMDLQFSIGVKGGKLACIEGTFASEEEDAEYSGEIKFSEIGKVKFDYNELDDLLDDALDYAN